MPQNYSQQQIDAFVANQMYIWEKAQTIGAMYNSVRPVADLIYNLLRAVEEGKPWVAKISADTEGAIVGRVARKMEAALADAEEVINNG